MLGFTYGVNLHNKEEKELQSLTCEKFEFQCLVFGSDMNPALERVPSSTTFRCDFFFEVVPPMCYYLCYCAYPEMYKCSFWTISKMCPY